MKYIYKLFILIVITTNSYAEESGFAIPNGLFSNCFHSEKCSSYFQYGMISFERISNNRSKLRIKFNANNAENERLVYIVTLPYEAIVSNISLYNMKEISAIPAQNSIPPTSKIPGALASVIKDAALIGASEFVKTIGSHYALAFDLFGDSPIQLLGRNPSVLSGLPASTLLGKQLYPYITYSKFFTSNTVEFSTITFTINKPLNSLVEMIKDKKMSVYIGGDKENEMLVEKFSATNTTGEGEINKITWSTGIYRNNEDQTEILTIAGADSLIVTVSGITEEDYDFLYIYDENGSLIKKLDGDINESFSVAGSKIRVKFTSDESETRSGVTVNISSGGGSTSARRCYAQNEINISDADGLKSLKNPSCESCITKVLENEEKYTSYHRSVCIQDTVDNEYYYWILDNNDISKYPNNYFVKYMY